MTPDELTICLAPLVAQLARIGDLLLMLAVSEEPETAPTCQHPEDQRADFGMTNGVADWQCLVCGERSIPTPQN